MALFDSYPTNGVRVFTNVTDPLDDFTIFMFCRVWMAGSQPNSRLIDRGSPLSEVVMARNGGNNQLGGGFANSFSYINANTLTWYPISLRRNAAAGEMTVQIDNTVNNITGASTATSSPLGADRFVIGDYSPNGLQPIYSGFCRVAIWNQRLSDREILSLNAGFHPHKIRPNALIWYSPFFANEKNYFGRTTNGTGTNLFSINNILPRIQGIY